MVGKVADARQGHRQLPPVLTINAQGQSPFVLVCDHAANFIPPQYDNLGLSRIDRLRHIAWDPGALALSLRLVDLLDAPLVHSTVSRLVIDCNRDVNSPGLIWTYSEDTDIAANQGLGEAEVQNRIAHYHQPFHEAIEALLNQRLQLGQRTILVCMHSFTPVYLGVARPWPIGLIHGSNTDFTAALRDVIRAEAPELKLGWNEPYAALNGVTLTLEKHGDGRGLDATMIEVRHDEILEPGGVARWGALLARWVEAARLALDAPPGAGSSVHAGTFGA